jgi:hypothetical protein
VKVTQTLVGWAGGRVAVWPSGAADKSKDQGVAANVGLAEARRSRFVQSHSDPIDAFGVSSFRLFHVETTITSAARCVTNATHLPSTHPWSTNVINQ